MGLGDVKLAFLMGLVLGFPRIIVALYLAFLTGAGLSVIMILLKKKRFGQTIAFGPFLVLGTLAALFWGNQLWQLLGVVLP
jgi:prepilin signal peptidase PulO-like enzyme (type II secretory pathway)